MAASHQTTPELPSVSSTAPEWRPINRSFVCGEDLGPARGDMPIDQRREFVRVPALPRRPPFLETSVGRCSRQRPVDAAPELVLHFAPSQVKVKTVRGPQETAEMGAKPQLGGAVQVFERLHSAQPKRAELFALHMRFHQVAPMRRQQVDRGAPAFGLLVTDLKREIDQRYDDTDCTQHLPDGTDHFPVHAGLYNEAARRLKAIGDGVPSRRWGSSSRSFRF